MCYCLDLRSDSSLAKVVSHKIVAAVTAVIQLIIWVSALFTMIAPPESVKLQLSSSSAGATAFAVIFILAGIGFSVLLLLGIFKNNRMFVQIYCVFIMVAIVLLIVGIVVNIFTQPKRFGLSGFLSSSLIILVDILTYFIIRNYYLSLTSLPPSNNPNLNRV